MKLLTVSEVARALSVSAETVRRWSNTGVLCERQRAGAGIRLYDAADVERFRALREKCREPIT